MGNGEFNAHYYCWHRRYILSHQGKGKVDSHEEDWKFTKQVDAGLEINAPAEDNIDDIADSADDSADDTDSADNQSVDDN